MHSTKLGTEVFGYYNVHMYVHVHVLYMCTHMYVYYIHAIPTIGFTM